jgi:hypothetical protein
MTLQELEIAALALPKNVMWGEALTPEIALHLMLEGRIRKAGPDCTVPAGEFIDIVFDGRPDAEGGRFVEVENQSGRSITFGRWIDRFNGLWALRIKAPVAQAAAPVEFIYQVMHQDPASGLIIWKDMDQAAYDRWNAERQGGSFFAGAVRKLALAEWPKRDRIVLPDSGERDS